MADWSLPTNSSLYTDYTSFLDARLDDAAVGLDPAVTTVTNPPTNTIRWTSASARWQKWNGTSWVDLSATYQISISGNAATATALQTARTINGVSFDGSANITVSSNTPSSITFNNGGTGAASGTAFNGGTAVTVSYNTVGAPSTTGTNASGTWPISITGSAATLTTARTINGVSFNGSANVVVEPYVESDETTNAARYLVFVDSTTDGYQRLNEDSGLSYNPSTNTLTVGTVAGALSGNATTATTLQTARNINGVSFNGSANITITANTTNALTFNSSGSGAVSGSSFNGSSAQTISYNSVGAPSTTGAGATGTWGINISGNAATATSAAACTGNSTTATTASSVTNGVYTVGDQTIGGTKTFSNTVVGRSSGSTDALYAFQGATSGGGFGAMWTRRGPFSSSVVHSGSSFAPSLSVVYEYTGSYSGVYSIGHLATSGANPGNLCIHHINSSGAASVTWLFDGATGDLTASGSVNALSDARLKTDLERIDGALNKLCSLTGYTYTRTDTGERQTGLIAQDVQKVLPEAVADGEHLAVAYGNLMGLVVEAVKELRADVNKLKGS